jgi:hypothetical protein
MIIPWWFQLVAMTGTTIVIVYGSIFDRPRNWLKSKHLLLNEFLSCSLCVGFWVGFGMSHMIHQDYTTHIYVGFACAASSWLYDSVVGCLQSIDVYYSRENK